MFFPRYEKLSNATLPTNTDLYVHIMYFISSKVFKFLERFRIGSQMALGPGPTLGFIGPCISHQTLIELISNFSIIFACTLQFIRFERLLLAIMREKYTKKLHLHFPYYACYSEENA